MGVDRGPARRRLSWQARLCGAFIRRVVRPAIALQRKPTAARARFLRVARWLFPDPPSAIYLPDRLVAGGRDLPALWARVGGSAQNGVLLYFHGGAYIMGSPRTHRAMVARLAGEAGLAAILPRYRLAPEHPFPAAVDDALAAYGALLARGYDARRIALGGDSAGGGLALALLARLPQLGLPPPGATVTFSPLTDLSFSGASVQENARRDRLLPVARAPDVQSHYLSGADPRDPRASPLFAGWAPPVPPVMLMVAESEILLDDSLRMAEALCAAGCEVRCEVWGDLPHVWPILQGRLPEADRALREAGRFLREAIAGS